MDYFAHGFWSYILFHKIKKPIHAVLWGLFPDTISWGVYFVYNLFTRGFYIGAPVLKQIPSWVYFLYGLSHSLVIVAVIFGIIYAWKRTIPLAMYAWPIHILIDIPAHTSNFLPTPFLWPLSSFAFPGISWASREFMIINYLLISASLFYIVIQKKNGKKST